MKLSCVVLCGGSGTRLWPLSREQYPKQLLKLDGEYSLLQGTLKRVSGLSTFLNIEQPTITLVGNEEYRFIIADQVKQVVKMPVNYILEPEGKNTAPALTLAALNIEQIHQDQIMLVLPSDHLITNKLKFHHAVKNGLELAKKGAVVCFGVEATKAETNYGYLKVHEAGEEQYTLEAFVEKPNYEAAEEMLSSGDYFWNSGMFMLKASTWLNLVKQLQEELYTACSNAWQVKTEEDGFIRVDKESFSKCPSESIDYAVMEKIGTVGGQGFVVPLRESGWTDLGAWDALWTVLDKDNEGNNIASANEDVVFLESKNSMVYTNNRLIALLGIDDAIVIDTADALLVASKDKLPKLKELVSRVAHMKPDLVKKHRNVHRPWGYFDSIDKGQNFQVKRIVVNPGEQLSLQMHHHRAEHWIVVKGTGKITKGDETFLLSENESTYIPIGVAHRLENPGKLPLEMIEVQSGSYLGEDDIVRFEDIYGRVSDDNE